MDEDTRALYFDLIEAALSDAARKAFAMLPQDYQFQGPSFLKGKLEGRALGEANVIVTVLETRGVPLGDDQRRRILACTDLDTLERWVRCAVTARTADELFAR